MLTNNACLSEAIRTKPVSEDKTMVIASDTGLDSARPYAHNGDGFAANALLPGRSPMVALSRSQPQITNACISAG